VTELATQPDASPEPLTRDTEPAPRLTARVAIPDDGLTNGAGEILNLLHGGLGGSVSILWSHAGAYRASHWHRQDAHTLYILEGELQYYERAVGSERIELEETFTAGDMFHTPSNREHLMIFSAPTIMISMSDRSRTPEEHEADVVRVPRESWDV
jgi:uncharacterized RmlC-like cupin family protein